MAYSLFTEELLDFLRKPARNIDEIILHCSASPDGRPDTTEDIRSWHVDGNGWSDIGYHLVIERDGKVGLGRPIWKLGAHCKAQGKNRNTIGICLVGTKDFDERQFDTLKPLLEYIIRFFNISKVSGHSDYDSRKPNCPGFDVGEYITKNNLL